MSNEQSGFINDVVNARIPIQAIPPVPTNTAFNRDYQFIVLAIFNPG